MTVYKDSTLHASLTAPRDGIGDLLANLEECPIIEANAPVGGKVSEWGEMISIHVSVLVAWKALYTQAFSPNISEASDKC